MAFQKGTWTALPSNCTRDYTLSYTRCAEYGTIALTECVSWTVKIMTECLQWAWQALQTCVSWVTTTAQSCISWASTTSSSCCTWWPCSWACQIVTTIVSWFCLVFATIVSTVCAAFAVVVSLVCIATAIVAIAICLAFAVFVWTFCLLWSVVEIVFCLSSANGGTAFLLTDGTVMVQECKSIFGAAWATRRWWKLTPDNMASYVNGSWSPLADSNVARKYFGSSVLADGRVIVCGGEYSDSSGTQAEDRTNTCEIYDPVSNTWTMISSPATQAGVTWPEIGDAPSTVLPDGTFLLGSDADANIAKFDPVAMSWTAMSPRPGVSDSDEDSWVLMPDGTVVAPSCSAAPTTWVYDIATDTWNQGNDLPTSIVDAGEEIGPGLLLYDGSAFFLGANQHTATFVPGAAAPWSNAGDLPMLNSQNLGVVDGPAALLVNGNVLFGAGPIDAKGHYLSPSSFFEFDGAAFNRTADPANNGCPTYSTRLLLLPNGDVMFAREDNSSFFAYTPASTAPQNSFRPVIQVSPATIAVGSTVQISGFQFNGLSQAVAYGDDSQTPTNYPLVTITNTGSGHIRFCRTFNHTTTDAAGNPVASMGVATGMKQLITTNVMLPTDIEPGASTLTVIANGIPSAPVAVTITSKGRGPHGK
jgi:hypothetical protein